MPIRRQKISYCQNAGIIGTKDELYRRAKEEGIKVSRLMRKETLCRLLMENDANFVRQQHESELAAQRSQAQLNERAAAFWRQRGERHSASFTAGANYLRQINQEQNVSFEYAGQIIDVPLRHIELGQYVALRGTPATLEAYINNPANQREVEKAPDEIVRAASEAWR